MLNISHALAEGFKLTETQVEATIALIDDGNTIPFIARYRKEATGGIDDATLRELCERLTYLRNLEARKAEVLRLIDEQGKLTPELRAEIASAALMRRVEDLYKPYRKKRATRASKARDAGLEPLAALILGQSLTRGEPLDTAAGYLNIEAGYDTPELALQGALDIIAEQIADDAEYTALLRGFTRKRGSIVSAAADADEKTVYETYYDFSEPILKIPDHRVLAINRGEKEEKLRVKVQVDDDAAVGMLEERVIKRPNIFTELLKTTLADSYKRLIAPSLEREMRNELTERAETDAIDKGVCQEHGKLALDAACARRPRNRDRPRLPHGLQGSRSRRTRQTARLYDNLPHAAQIGHRWNCARPSAIRRQTQRQRNSHRQRHGQP
jgi:uncharacterized protein